MVIDMKESIHQVLSIHKVTRNTIPSGTIYHMVVYPQVDIEWMYKDIYPTIDRNSKLIQWLEHYWWKTWFSLELSLTER